MMVNAGRLTGGVTPRSVVSDPYPRRLSLRANFVWTLAGNVVYAASQWGMLVVLAKLGSPDMIGAFALGIAVTTPMMLFSSFALRQVQVVDVREEWSLRIYLTLRLITTSLALLVLVGIILIVGYDREVSLIILLLGVARAWESFSDILYGFFQKHERLDIVSRSMIVKSAISLPALGAAVYLTGSAVYGAAAIALSWLCLFVGYDLRMYRAFSRLSQPAAEAGSGGGQMPSLRPDWQPRVLTNLAFVSAPLGVATALNSLNVTVPRYVLDYAGGTRTVGLYAAIASFLVAGTTTVTALSNATTPRLARHYHEDDVQAFRTLLLKLCASAAGFGIAGIAVAALMGEQILTLVYGAEYAAHAGVFVPVMIAAALGYVAHFLDGGLRAAQYFKIQPVIYALLVILNIGVCLVLIPEHGLLGAAWSGVIVGAARIVLASVCVLHALLALERRREARQEAR